MKSETTKSEPFPFLHQIGDGLSPISFSWLGQAVPRVVLRVMQLETVFHLQDLVCELCLTDLWCTAILVRSELEQFGLRTPQCTIQGSISQPGDDVVLKILSNGASVGETPAEVIKKCKYTIVMLSDPSAALSVVFDKDGVLEQICEGKGYINMSTVDAEASLKINQTTTGKGGRFIEGPDSGSKKPAEDGQLIIFAASDKALFEESIPAFDVLEKKSFYLGKKSFYLGKKSF